MVAVDTVKDGSGLVVAVLVMVDDELGVTLGEGLELGDGSVH